MAYSAGMRNERVIVLKRSAHTTGDFGRKDGSWIQLRNVWASVDWVRGVKSMREGALDAYDTVMVRMAWFSDVTRECRLMHGGITYQIESFHEDRRNNTIQITAKELQK